jgi:glutathione synthase/RimK-type ligase-like ATP-grasp enzyme
MYIHVLRHDGGLNAEVLFCRIAQQHGARVDVIDPRLLLFQKGVPDIVFARCELQSFSEPIFSDYYSALLIYEHLKLPIINSKHFLLVGQDKFLSALVVQRVLNQHPLRRCFVPATVRAGDRGVALAQGRKFLDRFGSVVVKLPCSGRGQGVWLAQDERTLQDLLTSRTAGEAVLLQQPIEKEVHFDGRLKDLRVEVVRDACDRPMLSRVYERIAPRGSFLTNLSQGGTIGRVKVLDARIPMFAERILDAVRGDVAGIDLAPDRDGNIWFFEVNIAFETSQRGIGLLGDRIWHDTLLLAQSRLRSLSPASSWAFPRPCKSCIHSYARQR